MKFQSNVVPRFGYCDDLSLAWEQLVSPVTPSPGSSVELSQAGLEFLTTLFQRHDQDGDQALSTQEAIMLFSTCPSMPWGPEVQHQVPLCPPLARVGLAGYLAWWHLTCLTQPDTCCQLLAHLGYDYCTPHLPHKQPPLASTKDKKSDLAKRQTNKSVYSCLVVGPRDAGKTTFCQRFLGRSIEETANIAADEKPKVAFLLTYTSTVSTY